MKTFTDEEESSILNAEINLLKKKLQLKVQKHGNFLHPEVISVSKELDKKIFDWMIKFHPQIEKRLIGSIPNSPLCNSINL